MKNKKNDYSTQHLLYLRGIKRKKIAVHAVRAGILAALVGLWELFAQVGVFDPFITSSPSRVAKTIADLAAGGTLFYHIGITLMETVTGILNVVVGIIAVMAVIVVIIGGVFFVTSQGDAGKVARARNTILYGVIGLVVALLAFAIVNFVLGAVFGGGSGSGGGTGGTGGGGTGGSGTPDASQTVDV